MKNVVEQGKSKNGFMKEQGLANVKRFVEMSSVNGATEQLRVFEDIPVEWLKQPHR